MHRTARVAASLFFLVCVPLSIWEQAYVAKKIFVQLDPDATAYNLLSNETIFRLSIVTHLAGTLVFAYMILLFYQIFRSVDKHLCRLMIFSLLPLIPVVFVFEVCNFMALITLKSQMQSAFTASQQQETVYSLLRMSRYAMGAGMGKLFLGLCFIPLGMLVLRSGFAPRIIGILFIIGGAGYVADCCIAILLQRDVYIMVRSVLIYTTICYMLALLWFMVKGVRYPGTSVAGL